MCGHLCGVIWRNIKELFCSEGSVEAVFKDEWIGLLEKGKKTLIDPYGATNPAEFFAVVTETFFEKPKQLRRRRPELYDEMKEFYGLDPEMWVK